MLSRTIVLLSIIILLGSCRTGPDIKWYVSQPNKLGIVRKAEVILYKDADGYFCLNPVDTEFVINYCYSTAHGPIDNPPKFYYINNSKGGFVRMQENEVIEFSKTINYSCMNPQDEQAFINWCFDIPGSQPIDEELETDYATK